MLGRRIWCWGRCCHGLRAIAACAAFAGIVGLFVEVRFGAFTRVGAASCGGTTINNLAEPAFVVVVIGIAAVVVVSTKVAAAAVGVVVVVVVLDIVETQRGESHVLVKRGCRMCQR